MRKLSGQERLLLGALAMSLVVLWLGLPDDSAREGRSAGESGRASMQLGDPPIVPLELLGSAAVPYDRKGRNPFEYHQEPQPVRPTKPPPRTPRVREPRPIRPAAESSVQPSRPQPAFDYIGYFGPKNDLIAVFVKGAEVLVARIGDVVDGRFELLEFRYDTVVLGCLAEEHEGSRVRLRASSS
jgi:hypothetical protein